jgi:hypothetical protein
VNCYAGMYVALYRPVGASNFLQCLVMYVSTRLFISFYSMLAETLLKPLQYLSGYAYFACKYIGKCFTEILPTCPDYTLLDDS